MCGRFANAQPPHQFAATVQHRLRREREDHQIHRSGESSHAKSSAKPSQSEQTSQSSSSSNSLPIQSQLSEGDYYPTHNVSPSSRVPILRLEKPIPLPTDGAEVKAVGESNAMIIECMRWGLLPAYTTSIPRGPDALRTINARDDSVLSGQGMWTPLLRKGKRCIIFCQGFFEWLKKPDGTRIAHFCGMQEDGEGRIDVNGRQRALMPMAGLYERCTIDEQEMLSFTIITTDSNKQLNFLHDRMPVILPDVHSMKTWLGMLPASSREVCSLLKPYDAGQLDVYPVPREVGKVGNDDKSFILPVSARKDGIAAAFGRVQKTEKDVNSETHAPMDEEVKAVDSPKRKRQMEADEQMAHALQKEEEERAKRMKSEIKSEGETSVKDESRAGDPSGNSKVGKDSNEQVPSSKFSPEPFNPPVSPPRPQGGYSTSTSDQRDSPRKGRSSGTPNKKLEEASKGTKDIRKFFKSK